MNTNPTNEHREQTSHAHCWHERRDAASYCCVCEELPCGLTELQKAMIEHDDDMARLDRNTVALSSRDAEIREVLEGLSYVVVSDGQRFRHWCGRREPCTPACLAARALYAKLQPKESSDVTE